jgi:hypothetical protein
LVAIAPSRIGDPLAFTPGFDPHCDVLTLALLDPPLLLLELLDAPAALVLVVDLLLPQPASATSTPTVTTATMNRTRGTR